MPGGHMAGLGGGGGPQQCRSAGPAPQAGEQGVDLVKLMITGGVLDATQKAPPAS